MVVLVEVRTLSTHHMCRFKQPTANEDFRGDLKANGKSTMFSTHELEIKGNSFLKKAQKELSKA